MYKFVLSPKMKPFGNFAKGIMNIGEAPGETEDTKGKQWQGKAGRRLQRAYKSLGIDLFEDCININATNCRPIDENGNNRTPTPHEVACCRKIVLAAIEQYKPKVIVLFGNIPIMSIIGHRWKKDLGGISKWRGWTIPDQDFKAWICPTFHSSFIERSENPVEELIWKQDLEQAISKLNDPFPIFKEPTIEVITDLSVINKPGFAASKTWAMAQAAFDYETTGLKPHALGHQIVCASIADSEDHAYSFLMPKTKAARQPFIDFLANPKIAKIAQNMKYEDTWSAVKLRQPVIQWAWDTMLATHQLDNRQGVTGLKFQTYVQFGVVDYDSEVSPYLKAVDPKNANSINRILEFMEKSGGTEKVLKYCGYDSVFEYRLSEIQRKLITPKIK
jgi:uracil-DNA glycosylase family 4